MLELVSAQGISKRMLVTLSQKDIDGLKKGEVENLDGNVRSDGRKSREIHRRESATLKRVAEMPSCVQ